MATDSLTIQLPTGKISALTWGDPLGYPILAIHGWLDNAASMIHIAPYFPNFRFIAIDLPGHGLSQHRPPESYFHFVDYVADIISIIEYFKWQDCILLGHSLGAAIQSMVAGTIPEQIKAVGLLDALGPFSTPEEQMPKIMRTAIQQYTKLSRKQLPCYSSIDEAIQARLKVNPTLKHSSVKSIVERGIKEINGDYHWRTDPRLLLKPLVMLSEKQIEAFLQQISAPVCLIRPDDGWPFDENIFTARTEHVKQLTTYKLPGHHHEHMDNPKEIGNLLNSFFVDHMPITP